MAALKIWLSIRQALSSPFSTLAPFTLCGISYASGTRRQEAVGDDRDPKRQGNPTWTMAESTHQRRLDSWKEIAAYLKRDERTAMRWAKDRGLPVHHVPGRGRGTVFAYAQEIEAWLSHPSAVLDSNGPEKAVAVSARPKIKRWTLASVAGGLVILSLIAFFLISSSTQHLSPERVTFSSNSVQVWDRRGDLLWEYQFPDPLRIETEGGVEWAKSLVRIVDLDGDGKVEVLVTTPTGLVTERLRTLLYCFSANGKLKWRYDPQDSFRSGGETFTSPWHFKDVLVSPQGKNRNIWVIVAHHSMWPSYVVKLDSTGQAKVQFFNSGSVFDLRYMKNSTGGGYILVGGLNDEYDMGCLAVLKEDDISGTSPQSVGSRYRCDNCPGGQPYRYFLFPRSQLNRLTNVIHNDVFQVFVAGNKMQIYTREASEADNAVYELPSDFEKGELSMYFSETYWRLHRRLEQEGKLDHSVEKCPERLFPKKARMWSAEKGWTDVSFAVKDTANPPQRIQ